MIEKYAEGCFRLQSAAISSEDIEALIQEASVAKLRRARICVHASDESKVQEMVVVLFSDSPKGTYKYGHDSSLCVLRGQMRIDFADGEVAHLSPDTPLIRITAGRVQTPKIVSDYVMTHEVYEGPFVRESHVIRV